MARSPAPLPPNPPELLGEGLLSPGTVRLFGRPFTGLTLGNLGDFVSRQNPLAVAMKATEGTPEAATLARIYGFTYLGNYFKLPEPLVFLVFGPALDVPSGSPTPGLPAPLMGMETSNEPFTDGIRMWPCDALDVAVRIDIRIGWIKDILLSEMSADTNTTGGGDIRRSDVVGNANMIGRDANLIGRDANLIGRDANLIGRNR